MLKPAILYKEILERKFAEQLYSDDYFYYNGYVTGATLPIEIKSQENLYQYAIVDKNDKVIGFLSYRILPDLNEASCFGLYSFDKGNYIIGKDLLNKMEELVNLCHRVSWKVVSGNPVKRSYDRFCLKHGGYICHEHDVTKDKYGNYHDMYGYEIINMDR